jgi:2-hydroxy-3-keto-5-methylthiopentenyl-1-phosphate phosphatase
VTVTPLSLVLDWDGTVTERDTLHMVIERFGDVEVFRRMEAELGRRMTLREVIGVEMATIRAPAQVVVDWLLEHVRIRNGFAELVAAHDPLIVSAGFHELIAPVLAREGIVARVVANHVEPDPTGWRSVFPDETRCAVCGEHCKRVAVDGLGLFAYVGDGVSDRCVSLAAARRFARAGLARWLEAQGAAFEPFTDLYDVTRALAQEPG